MIPFQDFATNLGVALVLGALIGVERELRNHDAGLRTNALVAAGAAVFTMISGVFTEQGRVAAQIVTGIGFIGAGSIIKQGDHVKGLTTAATLWVGAGIGMLAGLGFIGMAVFTTGSVLAVNTVLFRLEQWFSPRARPGAEPPRPGE